MKADRQIVYVVTGYIRILRTFGPVGVGATKEAAEKIAKANEYVLDKVLISEYEVEA